VPPSPLCKWAGQHARAHGCPTFRAPARHYRCSRARPCSALLGPLPIELRRRRTHRESGRAVRFRSDQSHCSSSSALLIIAVGLLAMEAMERRCNRRRYRARAHTVGRGHAQVLRCLGDSCTSRQRAVSLALAAQAASLIKAWSLQLCLVSPQQQGRGTSAILVGAHRRDVEAGGCYSTRCADLNVARVNISIPLPLLVTGRWRHLGLSFLSALIEVYGRTRRTLDLFLTHTLSSFLARKR
jgi:hypothetical protein